jgi:hypothetical protein
MAYSTIPKGSLYMNNVLWTGNNTARTITGVGFQPDFTWIKSRTQAYNHILTDVLRGTTKYLSSNTTTGETTDAQTLTAFASDGFSIGTSNLVNQNVQDHVAWNWKGGGTGSANTDGSINSTVSANTTSGFSIVQYVGDGGASATIGHGLGVKPKMFVVKSLVTDDWTVYNETDGPDYGMFWNSTAAKTNDSSYFNDTEPTSTVFTIGTNGRVNDIGVTYIAYCFADVQGFSKMGSYTGNGNVDGTFVYTGFKPAFVMIKRTSGTGGWFMFDNKRDTFNLTSRSLQADTSGAENNYTAADTMNLDILSNGFKLKSTDGAVNGSGSTYIYMAFAENPFVATSGTSAIPVTAR